MSRLCQNCWTGLPGRKGHGFISPDGRAVYCSFCAHPSARPWMLKNAKQNYGVTPTRFQSRLETPTAQARRAQAFSTSYEERQERRLLQAAEQLGYD